MNNLNFELNNLTVSNLSCDDVKIQTGHTFTALYGYVIKPISIDSAAKEAVVEILYYGDSIEFRLMKYNDIFTITNPDNSENKYDIILKSVYESGEIGISQFRWCTYTKQYSTLVMTLDLPSSVTDGQSYTVAGRLTKDRLNESLETLISNEKVYITESGTNIIETTTDSNGEFILTFTYHVNNSYEIYYPGTIDVTSNIKMLNATIAEGSTHVMKITFNEELPDYAITAFKTVSNPVESVIQILTNNGTITNLTGWQLKDIQLNKKQLIVYLKDMNISNLSTIKFLNAEDVISKILAAAVAGAILGMILGAIFPPAEPFTFTAGLILGTLVGIFSQWKVVISLLVSLPGWVIGQIFGTSDKDATSKEVNENAKEFLDVKLKECTDAYNSSSKDSDACILYAECMKNTYSNFQEYTQGYLFQKVSTSLTLNSKNLKGVIDTKCINKFKSGEISCDDLMSCVSNEGNNAILSGDSIIYNTYPKDDPYIAPWEKDNGGISGVLKNILLFGGIAVVGYIGYKAISK